MKRIRVLGIDPGRHLGAAVLSVGTGAADPLWCAAHTVTDDASLDVAVQRLREVAVEWSVDLAAIERVERVHGHARMGPAYAEGLVFAARVGAELRRALVDDGLDVRTVTREEWRRDLCGSGSADDDAVKRMVRLRVPAWPARSNDHERDACGVALWAGLGRRG